MKYNNNISLPYPVLGISDDVFPLLKDDCIYMAAPDKSSPYDYIFRVELKQENKKIAQLIEDGQAEYACEVTCKDTYLRLCKHSSSAKFEIKLPRRDVKGRINFNCFVAAKKPILGYSNNDFNEDYKGFTFDLEVGDLLVVFPMAYYNTEIKYDKLFAAGSFMQIEEAADGIDRVWFDLSKPKIMIEMPHDLYEQYLKIGNRFPEIIHSSLVHNALVYALINLSDYADKGLLWADSLMSRVTEPELRDFDLDVMDQVYKVADILLKNPYKRLLDSLEKINDNLNSEDD